MNYTPNHWICVTNSSSEVWDSETASDTSVRWAVVTVLSVFFSVKWRLAICWCLSSLTQTAFRSQWHQLCSYNSGTGTKKLDSNSWNLCLCFCEGFILISVCILLNPDTTLSPAIGLKICLVLSRTAAV